MSRLSQMLRESEAEIERVQSDLIEAVDRCDQALISELEVELKLLQADHDLLRYAS